eukprot:GEMP01012989.1.p1 GENE.GEMP01012989.1~~GEMP01012989.1.p1  ORF type:complete len:918 (+),score=226.78 GEMP01012989.1:33-2756(+)
MSDAAPEAADTAAVPSGEAGESTDVAAANAQPAAADTAVAADDAVADTAEGAADGAEEAVEAVEEEEEVPKELTEIEILQRMGEIDLESHKDESGVKGFFCNSNNFEKYGLITQKDQDDSVPFSGNVTFPYKILNKQAMLDEVKKVGFVSDFHPVQKEVEKYPLPEILIIRDHERVFGENFAWVNTKNSFAEWMERIEELRQAIIEEYNKSLLSAAAEGEGEEGAVAAGGFIGKEVDIVAKDLPITPRPWESETQQATSEEVAAFTVAELRPALQIQIQRKRMHFGQPVKFNDAQENVHLCRPQKDPNFALHRRELELGIQAVKSYSTVGTQTTWYKPQNAIIQYSTADFIKERTAKERYSDTEELAALHKFISNVARSTEEALQQNETIDIFKDEFSNLGEEDFGYGSKSQANLKEHRNWHDVTYTKGKRIEAVEWVPGSTTMLACSCCDSAAFSERYESSGKAETSYLLFWSFLDSISPQTVLVSPWDATVFKFYPSDPTYMVAGLANGQLAIWRLSPSDLSGDSRERKANGSGGQVPQMAPKMLSVIDDGHKKAVSFIYWLPTCLEIERKGKTSLKQKWDENDPIRFFITISGDGQFLIWDFIAARDSLTDPDFQWKPVHRVQLQRQDSGTEMGLCQLLYRLPQLHHAGSEEDEGQRKKAAAAIYTNFYASTEEGEVMFGDWAAKADDDRKPEFCKKILTISKTFRPMYCLQRSPFFPDLILGVVDWGFYLWKEGEKEHIFSSPAAQSYFTCASWSPTRPSVIFFGRLDGSIDVWDFSDQSHKPSVSHPAASVALSTLVFVPDAAATDLQAASQLAVGDEQGHLHVLFLPKNLVKAAREEMSLMQRFIDREVVRINYFLERKEQLAEKKKVEEVVEEEAGVEKEEKLLQDQYEAFEKWCVENLK